MSETNEEKKKKNWLLIIIILLLLLIIAGLVIFIAFNRKHKVTINTNGGNEVEVVVKDNVLEVPPAPKKEGYKFAGWYDENDKLVEKDTKITSDIKLIAKWVVEYSCPDDCEVSKDGKSCTIVETANVTKKTSCPSGTESVEYFCTKKATGDGWSSPAISCKGNKTGYCVKSSSKGYDLYNYSTNSCPGGYLEYSFAEHGGAMMGCLKKYNKVQADSCPNGYKKDGNKCKKTTTKSCTKNVAKEY